ncbi:MAG: lipopolysaccharide biosynthesis protein [Xanthomonadaceae bacterium]|nr:lipopolysaccharide biosynthesis protein [Xanthomonadaceae bacterium]
MNTRRTIGNAGLLMAANLAGMALPLVALPILARRLGIDAFGLVALAQSVGMLPVLLVDAGFNSESMRATGEAVGTAPLQPLLDNLIARLRLGLLAAGATLLLGLAIPVLPLAFVAIALLQLAGTLLFPQWWLIATGAAPQLLALQLGGRLLSVLGIVWLVQSPDDAALALALQCGATLLSGLGFVVLRLLPRLHEMKTLDRGGHRALTARALPAAGSGFAVALAAQTPQWCLGALAGLQQVGLYACGDRIARAGVYALGAIDQSFLAPVARRAREGGGHASGRMANRVILALFALSAFAGLVLALAADRLVPWLFGAEFAGATVVVVLFAAWLPLQATRRAFLGLRFAAHGHQELIARCQVIEAIAIVACAGIGAALHGATGAATGLLITEAVAWTATSILRPRTGSSP